MLLERGEMRHLLFNSRGEQNYAPEGGKQFKRETLTKKG